MLLVLFNQYTSLIPLFIFIDVGELIAMATKTIIKSH